jgi:hypothetical protein
MLLLRLGLFRLGARLLHLDLSPMTPEEIAWAQRVAAEIDARDGL